MTARSVFRCIGSAVTLLAGFATGSALVAAGSVFVAAMMLPPFPPPEAPKPLTGTITLQVHFLVPDDEPTATEPDALAVISAEFDAAIDRAAKGEA